MPPDNILIEAKTFHDDAHRAEIMIIQIDSGYTIHHHYKNGYYEYFCIFKEWYDYYIHKTKEEALQKAIEELTSHTKNCLEKSTSISNTCKYTQQMHDELMEQLTGPKQLSLF